jgi:hypothetical protein
MRSTVLLSPPLVAIPVATPAAIPAATYVEAHVGTYIETLDAAMMATRVGLMMIAPGFVRCQECQRL